MKRVDFMPEKNLVALIILDGYGIAKPNSDNAVSLAKTPNMDFLTKKYPNSQLLASGLAVGLPEGQMGNSEVGHLNLGAGRIVYQSLTRINQTIVDGSFFNNKAYLSAIEHAKKHNSKLHILGLVSDGGVHSHLNHFKAMIELTKKHHIFKKTYIHAFLDGRDTPPKSGLEFVRGLKHNTGVKFATVQGRYYAMDRDNNWDRLQKGYDAMVNGIGENHKCPGCSIKASYANNITDEFMIPVIIDKTGLIESNDAIIFLNFRPDRAIRIATALSNPAAVNHYYVEGKPHFTANPNLNNLFFVSTMHYADTVKGEIAFGLQPLDNLYGDVISQFGLKQLRVAETEKYAHVTFFFDGGVDREIKGATRILVPSPKVATYDLKPEMSAYEVTEKVLKELTTNHYDTMILNFANPDMVGHTGILSAAIKAVETVDECLGKVVDEILKQNGVAIIIADHGNAEDMVDENGAPHTAHTTNPVPVIITKKGLKLRADGILADIAPTMLELLEIDQPLSMTGKSLIIKE